MWKGPDHFGYFYTTINGVLLNVRRERGIWQLYVDGEWQGSYSHRHMAQQAGEDAASATERVE